MEETLSISERELIQSLLDGFDTMGSKILRTFLFTITAGLVFFYFIMQASFGLTVGLGLGLLLIMTITWFYISKLPQLKLQKDLESGVKIIETVTIDNINIKENVQSFRLSNGLTLSEEDFQINAIQFEDTGIGKKLLIAFTPYDKMVLNVKEIK